MERAEGRRSTEGASFTSPGRSPGDSLNNGASALKGRDSMALIPKPSSQFARPSRRRRFHPVGVSNVGPIRFLGLRPRLLNLTPSGSALAAENAIEKAGRSLKLAANMPVASMPGEIVASARVRRAAAAPRHTAHEPKFARSAAADYTKRLRKAPAPNLPAPPDLCSSRPCSAV